MAQACWGHTGIRGIFCHGQWKQKSSKLAAWLAHSSPRDNTTSSTTMETEEPFQTPWTQQEKAENCPKEQDATKSWTWGEHDQFPDFLTKGKAKSREDCAWQHLQNTTGCNGSVTILNGLKIPYFMKGAGLNTNSFSNRTELISWEHSEFSRCR